MDILNIVSVINIFGFILLMDYCARKRKKITLPVIVIWIICMAIGAIIANVAMAAIEGKPIDTEGIADFGGKLLGIMIAFLIINLIMFFIAKFIYNRVPSIAAFLGHNKAPTEEDEKNHMTKLIIYTHERVGTEDFKKLKEDVVNVMKENRADSLEVEEPKGRIRSKRKKEKN